MIVVKKCNQCGAKYDVEFMSNESCPCQKQHTVAPKPKPSQPVRKSKWDNVPMQALPTRSNRRQAEADAIKEFLNNNSRSKTVFLLPNPQILTKRQF